MLARRIEQALSADWQLDELSPARAELPTKCGARTFKGLRHATLQECQLSPSSLASWAAKQNQVP